MKKPGHSAVLNGPVTLTLSRIIIVLPFVILLMQNNTSCRIAALILFLVASITDHLDGLWARQSHKVTSLGAFLDPLADKILINVTFLAFVSLGIVPMWMFAIILIRDFIIDGLRMVAAEKGKVIPALFCGKLKTTFQMITLISLQLNLILQNSIIETCNMVLLYVVVILTTYSGAVYLFREKRLITK